jgi:hypothetical protein
VEYFESQKIESVWTGAYPERGHDEYGKTKSLLEKFV